jgi:hypothetical protein
MMFRSELPVSLLNDPGDPAGAAVTSRLPSPRAWRIPHEDALVPVDQPISNNGPYAINQGVIAATTHHEAAHAVAHVVMGGQLENIEIVLRFERLYGGIVGASVGGRCRPKRATRDATEVRAAEIGHMAPSERPSFCWRNFLGRSIYMLAGPAGDIKYRSGAGLARGAIGGPDRQSVELTSRLMWLVV